MSRLNVALIGAGMIAGEAHIPAYLALGDRAAVSAVCDKEAERARACAVRYGISRVYTDAAEMLDREKPDLVSIVTPNQFHVPMTKLALERGANVLCEKPLAFHRKDACELYALAQKKGLLLMACQTARFQRNYYSARRYTEEGVLGTSYYGEITHIRRRGVPTWGHFLDRNINGGGALVDIGVHVIDAMLWILGSPQVKSVIGTAFSGIASSERNIRWNRRECGMLSDSGTGFFPYIPSIDVEEFASGLMLTDGPSIHFKVAWAANLPSETRLTALGDKAGMVVPDLRIYSTFREDQADITPRLFAIGPYDSLPFSGHYYLIRNMADTLQNGAELFVKPEETINTTTAIELYYKSIEKGGIAFLEEV